MNETLLNPDELEAVRRRFGVTLERGDVVRLLRLLGYRKRKVRDLIEGKDATLKPLPPNGFGKRNRWSRESILNRFNLPVS